MPKDWKDRENWEYLGDGVYAFYDGYGVMIHVNSHDQPTDKVYLEPPVLDALKKFYSKKTKGE